MHSLTSILFVVVLVVALNSLPTSSKTVPTTKLVTTTTVKPTPTTVVSAKKPAATASKPKKKPAGKRKKNLWKVPNASDKKLFNDYKAIIRTKIIARHPNVTATFQPEPARHGVQTDKKTVVHHFLVKLPDGKFAHAAIGVTKDGKKPMAINENAVLVHRSIYDTLEAAEP